MLLSIVIFVLTLLVLVLIHELGHFLMAKKFGIKVEEFGFGFPPRAWGKKIGETLVSVNWLPLGGFVRLLGEDGTDKEVSKDSRSFSNKGVWERITVVVAGVFMNLVLASLIFYLTLGFSGFKFQVPLIVEHQFLGVTQKEEQFVIIAQVVKNSPAQKANLKAGDQIIAIDGQTIKSGQDLVDTTKNMEGKQIVLSVLTENQKEEQVKLTARKNPPAGQGPLGVAISSFRLANLEYQTPMEKLLAGPLHSINLTVYSAKVLGKVIGQSFARKNFQPLSTSVSGPVGIASMANDILTQSAKPFLSYLDFIGLISLNLALINLLPIPAMDGGRLFFLLIEALSGKKVHAGFERWVHTIGMVLLLGLAVLITFSDVGKLLPK